MNSVKSRKKLKVREIAACFDLADLVHSPSRTGKRVPYSFRNLVQVRHILFCFTRIVFFGQQSLISPVETDMTNIVVHATLRLTRASRGKGRQGRAGMDVLLGLAWSTCQLSVQMQYTAFSPYAVIVCPCGVVSGAC